MIDEAIAAAAALRDLHSELFRIRTYSEPLERQEHDQALQLRLQHAQEAVVTAAWQVLAGPNGWQIQVENYHRPLTWADVHARLCPALDPDSREWILENGVLTRLDDTWRIYRRRLEVLAYALERRLHRLADPELADNTRAACLGALADDFADHVLGYVPADSVD